MSVAITVRYQKPDGQDVEQSFTDVFTIGRDPRCEVQFESQTVSSLHARVTYAMGGWSVQDQNSRNGLYVEGQRVQRVEIKGPTQLHLGPDGPMLELSVGEALSARRAPGAVAPAAVPGTAAAEAAPAPASLYQGNGFTFTLREDWQDHTIYVFTGPVTDDVQHNLTIIVDRDLPVEALADYVDWHLMTLDTELAGYRLLARDEVTLDDGTPACRVLYSWDPMEDWHLYQEQLYILREKTGYKLTATFTKQTRKTLGPDVARMMLSFSLDH